MIDENLLNKLKKIKGIQAIYLFGSCARGKQHHLSDIDVCIIGKLNEKQKSRIRVDFPEKFDVSFFDELPIAIKFRVFKEGKALFVRNIEFVNIIKFKTLQEYLDFKPLINRYIKEVLNVQL